MGCSPSQCGLWLASGVGLRATMPGQVVLGPGLAAGVASAGRLCASPLPTPLPTPLPPKPEGMELAVGGSSLERKLEDPEAQMARSQMAEEESR